MKSDTITSQHWAPLEPSSEPRGPLQNFHSSLLLCLMLCQLSLLSSNTSISKIAFSILLLSCAFLITGMKTPITFIGFLWKCKTMFQQHCIWGGGEGRLAWTPNHHYDIVAAGKCILNCTRVTYKWTFRIWPILNEGDCLYSIVWKPLQLHSIKHQKVCKFACK